MILSIFSYARWPSICLLWRNVYLGLLPIFQLGFFFVVVVVVELHELFIYFVFFFFFVFSRAAPVVYGGSQARGPIGAVAAGLHHSHSNTGSEPCLRPTPQLTATLDPPLTERGRGSRTCNLMVPSRIR